MYSFQNGTLRTCVLRFGGIYGPGESAMQDRIVNSVNRGAFGMFMSIMITAGNLFVNSVGNFVGWVQMTGILIAVPGMDIEINASVERFK